MDESSNLQLEVKVYKYRWVILLIFCLYAAINFVQFLEYSIIANIIKKYYNVEDILVDLTGLIFMINFIVFCLPVNQLIEKYNLRVTAIISNGLTAAGNLIKLLSVSPDRFYVALIGQFLCALGQVFMLSIPSKLASTWFGSEEVSTASAIAVLGTQIGVGIGCVFPANIVKNSSNLDDIGEDLFTMMIINASITCALFLLVLLFFRAKPEIPPSQSQVTIIESERLSILEIIKLMIKRKDYILLLVIFGSSNGLYSSFGLMINEVYLNYFPGSESDVGIVSAMAVVAGGCIGSVVFGLILDKWHKFKLTSFCIIIGSAISYIFVIWSFEGGVKVTTYVSIPIFGFFIASTLLVGFEFATEVMYPVPEAASCSVLNSFIYLFSIAYTLIFNALFTAIGYIATNVIIVVILILSSILIYFMSSQLHRRAANLQIQ